MPHYAQNSGLLGQPSSDGSFGIENDPPESPKELDASHKSTSSLKVFIYQYVNIRYGVPR